MRLTALGRAAGAALALALGTAGAGLAATPALARPAADPVPAAVSLVVPLTLRSAGDGLLDADALETATSPAGTLTRALDELLATSATIALDPMIPASIRVLGTAAPESAREWLARLEAAPNEVFLLAYADADLTSFARADALDAATPLGFGFALDEGAFGPAESPAPTGSPTPTPTPTASPDDDAPPPLPTTEEVLAWPDAIGRIAWPAEGSAAAADLDAYAAAGFDAVLLASENLSETDDALADVDGMRVIVADSDVSALFRTATGALDDTLRQLAIDRLGAALDGLAAAHPGRRVVLTLDRTGGGALPGLAETYAALVARPTTVVVDLARVLAATPVPARVVDGPAEAPHVAAMPALLAATRDEAAFSTILDDPELLTAPRRLELLQLLAVHEVVAADWPARADAFLAASAAILGAVTIVETGDLLVTSSATSIPIRLANALDHAVTVRLDARPLRPRLRIEAPVEVTIEPGSSKNVRLEAQAITNGAVVVVVSLSSPRTGVPIGTPRSLDVELQAQWEAVGLVVGAAVVLVFAAGLVRNVVVRRRRARAERAAEDARRLERA